MYKFKYMHICYWEAYVTVREGYSISMSNIIMYGYMYEYLYINAYIIKKVNCVLQ